MSSYYPARSSRMSESASSLSRHRDPRDYEDDPRRYPSGGRGDSPDRMRHYAHDYHRSAPRNVADARRDYDDNSSSSYRPSSALSSRSDTRRYDPDDRYAHSSSSSYRHDSRISREYDVDDDAYRGQSRRSDRREGSPRSHRPQTSIDERDRDRYRDFELNRHRDEHHRSSDKDARVHHPRSDRERERQPDRHRDGRGSHSWRTRSRSHSRSRSRSRERRTDHDRKSHRSAVGVREVKEGEEGEVVEVTAFPRKRHDGEATLLKRKPNSDTSIITAPPLPSAASRTNVVSGSTYADPPPSTSIPNGASSGRRSTATGSSLATSSNKEDEGRLDRSMHSSHTKATINGTEVRSSHTERRGSGEVKPSTSAEPSPWRKVNADSDLWPSANRPAQEIGGSGDIQKVSHHCDKGPRLSKDATTSASVSLSSSEVKHVTRPSENDLVSSDGDPSATAEFIQPQLCPKILLPNELPVERRERNATRHASSEHGGKEILVSAKDRKVTNTQPTDPRLKHKRVVRQYRTALNPVTFVWDANSVGKKPPPPARTVVVTGLSALVKVHHLLSHFRAFGRTEYFKLEVDPKIGQSLGIFWVTYAHDFDETGKVLSSVASDVTPQHGPKIAKTAQKALDGTILSQNRVKAFLGRHPEVVDRLVKEKIAESEAKLRPPAPPPSQPAAPSSGSTSTTKATQSTSGGKTAMAADSPRARSSAASTAMPPPDTPRSSRLASQPYGSSQSSRSAPASHSTSDWRSQHSRSDQDARGSGDASWRSRREEDDRRRSRLDQRSDSSRVRAQGQSSRDSRDRPREASSRARVDDEDEDPKVIERRLQALGSPYIFIKRPKSSDITLDHIRRSLSKFELKWIQQSEYGFYVAFKERSDAHNCHTVIQNVSVKGYSLSLELRAATEPGMRSSTARETSVAAKPQNVATAGATVKKERSLYDTGLRPPSAEETKRSEWSEAELCDAAFRLIQKELADSFIRDVKSRVVTQHLASFLKPNNEGGQILARAIKKAPAVLSMNGPTAKVADSRLPSFRRTDIAIPKKAQSSDASAKSRKAKPSSKTTETTKTSRKTSKTASLRRDADAEADTDSEDEERTQGGREHRRRSLAKSSNGTGQSSAKDKTRRDARKALWSDESESDSESESEAQMHHEAASRSISASVESPSTTATSIQDGVEEAVGKLAKPAAKKAASKANSVSVPSKKASSVKKSTDAALEDSVAAPKKVKASKPAPIPTDPFEAGLVQDAEDLFYLKLALQRLQGGEAITVDAWPEDEDPLDTLMAADPEDDGAPQGHLTGSARTEGMYCIAAAKKAAHLPDRNKASAEDDDATAAQHVLHSARNSRADSRRLVLGFEQHKRETATDTDIFKFNQLRTRKKQLKFAKSPIHDWGLYAMEYIPAGDMVIEYVGEVVRQQVADEREKQYERQGNFSTYLFRVDDDLVVDATHKGNIARLMNHCCTPNCTAKILTLNGEKRIVLFAKNPIKPGEELTYDYKFQSSGDDEDAIACLCGSPGCRRFL